MEITEKYPDTQLYTPDEVLQQCMEYFNGDELAATTWMNKYCIRSNTGLYKEKSPADMHHRMAHEFARIEKKYSTKQRQLTRLSSYGQKRQSLDEKAIFQLFDQFKYLIPQGSVMALLGNTEALGSLSNCVVLPPPVDSYGGIFKNDQQLAQLCKRRCGVGFDISSLRPSGSSVSNAAVTSSGAVSFMERFSNTT